MSDSAAKLNKIVEKYDHRFQRTLTDFKRFVETRVQLNQTEQQKLFSFLDQKYDEEFAQETLEELLRILSAFQSGRNVRKMNSKELKSFYKIKFISKKDGEKEKQKKQEAVSEEIKQKERQSIIRNQKQLYKKQLEQLEKQRQEREAQLQQEQKSSFQYHQVEQISDDDQEQKNNLAQQRGRQRLNTIAEESEASLKNTTQINTKSEPDQKKGENNGDGYDVENIDYNLQQSDDSRKVESQKQAEKRNKKYQKKYQIVVDPSLEEEQKIFKREKEDLNRNLHQFAEDLTMEDDVISITRYEKTGQDYINPVIKFQITYKNQFITWRRYSQIQKLMGYLRKKYQGVVLPEMPPKQGLKGGLTYFWGLDESFLFERREKLCAMLNRLMQKKEISKDQKLIKFLTDENYQIPVDSSEDNYWQALTGWKDIVLNYSELKDYGVAYYKYASQYKNKTLVTELALQYEELQESIQVIRVADEHRRKINANFDRRREIMYNFDVKVRQLSKTQLDKILQKAYIECKQMAIEYANYVQLKSNESWLLELKKQKSEQQGTKSMAKINNDLQQTTKRIKKIQTNFSISIKEYKKKLEFLLENLGKNLIEWRKKIHP